MYIVNAIILAVAVAFCFGMKDYWQHEQRCADYAQHPFLDGPKFMLECGNQQLPRTSWHLG